MGAIVFYRNPISRSREIARNRKIGTAKRVQLLADLPNFSFELGVFIKEREIGGNRTRQFRKSRFPVEELLREIARDRGRDRGRAIAISEVGASDFLRFRAL